MGKPIVLSIQQRERGLINLIEDAKRLGFNGDLIKGYEEQLKQIQKELKRDKEKSLSYNNERRLK